MPTVNEHAVPNKVDSTLDFNTTYAQDAPRGKHPIVAKTVTTTDIPSSEVVEDWEERNDKAITIPRQKEDAVAPAPVNPEPTEPTDDPGSSEITPDA